MITHSLKQYSYHIGILYLALGLALPVSAQQRGAGAAGAAGTGRAGTSGAARQYPNAGTIGDAYFSVDPETRRVVVIAPEETIPFISQVLTNLDRPKPQVLIKVVILEVTRNKSSDIGVEGGFRKNIDSTTTGNGANAFGLSGLALSGGTNAPGANIFGQPLQSFQPMPPGAGLYQILGQDYQVTLRAIAQAGNARVLSRPSILARNNQPATIVVGQTVPLITSVRYDTFGNATSGVTYTDVGIILRVTPFITSDGMVEMIVQPEISSVSATEKVPIATGVSAQVIDKRSADTVVVTPDGQTVIIGGLIQNQKTDTESKIPVLGDIPLLGAAFKRKAKTDMKTELMIFLTPHIVQAPGQLAALSASEQEKAAAPKSFSEEELDRFLDNLPTKEETPSKKKQRK
jgi:general secretion pathway protein D